MAGMERQGREKKGRANGMGQLLQERAREGHLSTSGSIVDGYGDSGPQREHCPVRKLSQGCRPGISVGPSPQVVTTEAGQMLCFY